MTGSRGHASERRRGAGAVVAAYAGTGSDHDALGRAMRILRQALPDARITLLWPADSVPCVTRDIDRVIDYAIPTDDPRPDDGARGAALRAVDALSRLRAGAALVFAEQGAAPYLPAYLCYLAGIAYRAGFETEFGGAVLSPALRAPRGLRGEELHVALLAAVGLARGVRPPIASPSTKPSVNRSIEC